MAASNVLREGWLEKKGSFSWKEVWVMIVRYDSSSQLQIHAKQPAPGTEQRAQTVYTLENLRLVEPTPVQFRLIVGNDQPLFRTSSEDERKAWVAVLLSAATGETRVIAEGEAGNEEKKTMTRQTSRSLEVRKGNEDELSGKSDGGRDEPKEGTSSSASAAPSPSLSALKTPAYALRDNSQMSGYLEKTPVEKKNWKKFYFVLVADALYCYRSPKEAEPEIVFDMSRYQVLPASGVKTKRQHAFVLGLKTRDHRKIVEGEQILFNAENNNIRKTWMTALGAARRAPTAQVAPASGESLVSRLNRPVDYAGFLNKADANGKHWRRVYFALSESTFLYCKSSTETEPIETFNVVGATVTATTDVGRPWAFKVTITSQPQPLILAADDPTDRALWTNVLGQASSKSKIVVPSRASLEAAAAEEESAAAAAVLRSVDDDDAATLNDSDDSDEREGVFVMQVTVVCRGRHRVPDVLVEEVVSAMNDTLCLPFNAEPSYFVAVNKPQFISAATREQVQLRMNLDIDATAGVAFSDSGAASAETSPRGGAKSFTMDVEVATATSDNFSTDTPGASPAVPRVVLEPPVVGSPPTRAAVGKETLIVVTPAKSSSSSSKSSSDSDTDESPKKPTEQPAPAPGASQPVAVPNAAT